MDSVTKLKIEGLKFQIGELQDQIKELSDGCGSWFQPEGATDSIQCGHGEGQCPGCAPKAEAADDTAVGDSAEGAE